MAVFDVDGASKTCRGFFKAYLEAQNLELALKYLCPDVEVASDAQAEPARGLARARLKLANGRAMRSQGFIIVSDRFSQSALSENMSAVSGVLTLQARDDAADYSLNIYAVCRYEDNDIKIRALNMALKPAGAAPLAGDMWRILLSDAPGALAVLSARGGEVASSICNAEMRKLLGLDAGPNPRMDDWPARIVPADAAAFKAALARIEADGGCADVTFNINARSEIRRIGALLAPLRRGGADMTAVLLASCGAQGNSAPRYGDAPGNSASRSGDAAGNSASRSGDAPGNSAPTSGDAPGNSAPTSGDAARTLNGLIIFETADGRVCRMFISGATPGAYIEREGATPAEQLAATAHPDDREELLDAFAAVEGGGNELNCSFRQRQRDGAYRWVNIEARARSGDARRRVFFGICINLSAAAWERIEKSQSENVVSDLPTAIAVFEIKSGKARDLYWSDAYGALFGLNREQMSARMAAGEPLGPLEANATERILKLAHDADADALCELECAGVRADGAALKLRATFYKARREGRDTLLLFLRSAGAEPDSEAINFGALARGESELAFDYDADEDALMYRASEGDQCVRHYSESIARGLSVHPSDRERLMKALKTASGTAQSGVLEFRLRTNAQDYRWKRAIYMSGLTGEEAASHIIGRLYDVQSEKEREQAKSGALRLAALFKRAVAARAWLMLTYDIITSKRVDTPGDVLPEEMPGGMTMDETLIWLRDKCVHPDERRMFMEAIYKYGDMANRQEPDEESVSDSVECRMLSPDRKYDGYRWMRAVFALVQDEGTGHRHIFISMFDINERRQREQYYERQVNIDELTGLMSRAAIEEKCKTLELSGDVDGIEKTLAVIAIDKYQALCEAKGHIYADGLLKQLADTLSALSHEGDLNCRLDDDVFGVMMNMRCTLDVLRERLRIVCEALTRRLDDATEITVSLGAAVAPRDGVDFATLYDKAERALRYVQEHGGDSFMIYGADEAELSANDAPADAESANRVYVRTFGYFDVFIDGRAIMFNNAKAKELLALMVDRRGGFISAGEMISALWPDEEANTVTMSRCRKTAMRLKIILQENGIEDIVETQNGRRRVIPEKVDCDCYRYLSGAAEYSRLFTGAYMNDYPWAESTLAALKARGDERN